jgi:hypothetical protein
VVQGWLVGFATKDESAKPHIQKSPVFNFRQRAIRHIVLDVFLIFNPCSHSCLPRRTLVLVWIYRSCDFQAGHHIYIGKSGGHWPMDKKEGICAV